MTAVTEAAIGPADNGGLVLRAETSVSAVTELATHPSPMVLKVSMFEKNRASRENVFSCMIQLHMWVSSLGDR